MGSMTSDPLASSDTPYPAPQTTSSDTSKPAKKQPKSGGTSTDKPTTPEDAVKFTKAAAMWGALIFGFLVLIVLLIFIAQNTESAEFAFLGWHWSLPLGVAIMFAAVAGGLLTVAVGAVRIFQLRRAAKKNLKAGL